MYQSRAGWGSNSKICTTNRLRASIVCHY